MGKLIFDFAFQTGDGKGKGVQSLGEVVGFVGKGSP